MSTKFNDKHSTIKPPPVSVEKAAVDWVRALWIQQFHLHKDSLVKAKSVTSRLIKRLQRFPLTTNTTVWDLKRLKKISSSLYTCSNSLFPVCESLIMTKQSQNKGWTFKATKSYECWVSLHHGALTFVDSSECSISACCVFTSDLQRQYCACFVLWMQYLK